jgi:hypothetical protein
MGGKKNMNRYIMDKPFAECPGRLQRRQGNVTCEAKRWIE